ncbi:MAG: enoyl-CoA hydratase-related protein [Novosphingobium sp.]|nr:enoyl-CoA hydratase-related protein [Novosphingobium sp.]
MNDVTLSIADGVGLVTLNRPEKLNAFSDAMHDAFDRTFAEAIRSPDVRVIVLTGAGRAFCAGADLARLDHIADSRGATFDIPRPGNPVPALAGLDAPPETLVSYTLPLASPKPVIGAIHGACVGIGLVLAASCDVRILGRSAMFAAAFAQRGIVAEFGLAWLLPRLVGLDMASDMLLSGRRVEAEEAVRAGLASRIEPDEALLDAALAYAREIAATASPRSTAIIKRQIHAGLSQGFADATASAWDLLVESFHSEDFGEAVRSFRERRDPGFTG